MNSDETKNVNGPIPSDPLVAYYSRRAPEYEQIWHRDDPRRQAEQSALAAMLGEAFPHRRVLEVACGTGYWTRFAAAVAERVMAIDLSAEMLSLARQKQIPRADFREGNAYELGSLPGPFQGGLAAFWISHVPRQRLQEFLSGFHHQLSPGARVVLADNVYVPGLGGELVTHPGVEDTFKRREQADGSTVEVLKNYYNAKELLGIIGGNLGTRLTESQITIGKSFWWAAYSLRES